MRAAALQIGAEPTEAAWFGQPPGLTILFLTEMWEQFSFYGMRALLVYYMTKQLLIRQQDASIIYGVYAAGVFLTPLLGGVISDRWLGRRSSVVLGALIMAAGHFMMAFPASFYPALVTIAVGSGLFTPSLPSQIESLYGADDPRRRSAYNVYYVGINLGAFLAPLVAGTVGELYGWHWGFAIAGFGMVVGLLTYVSGARYLPPDNRPRAFRASARRPAKGEAAWSREAIVARFLLLVAIAGCVVVFRTAYEQVGNTLALWLDQGVDRHVGGHWSVPMTWFQALNPLIVFTLTPAFVVRWTRQAARGREPSSIVKMTMGAGLVALAYLMMAAVDAWSSAHGLRTNWLWLVAFFLVMTAGELFILPIGLGLFGRLAPAGLSATTIATWYVAGFFGNLGAGWLGTFWGRMPHSVFLALVALIALASGALLSLLARRTGRVERAALHVAGPDLAAAPAAC